MTGEYCGSVFRFNGSAVPVREDLRLAYIDLWSHLGAPGPTLTGSQRVQLGAHARAVREGDTPPWVGLPDSLLKLAATLFRNPAAVDGTMVRGTADEVGDPMTVETIAVVSMLAAVDGAHRGLGAELEPLPEPAAGNPTGEVAEGLKRRCTHTPMPPGAIPAALDLLPAVGEVFRNSYGPQYMTEAEMDFANFRRDPGLDRAQIEIVSSRTSLLNECFY